MNSVLTKSTVLRSISSIPDIHSPRCSSITNVALLKHQPSPFAFQEVDFLLINVINIHHKGFLSNIGDLFRSSKYLDLTICCGSDKDKVSSSHHLPAVGFLRYGMRRSFSGMTFRTRDSYNENGCSHYDYKSQRPELSTLEKTTRPRFDEC